MNKEASNTRSNLIKEEYQNFSAIFDTEEELKFIIKDTLFSDYLESSDVSSESIYKFAFSTYITKKLVANNISTINSLEDYFFISKLVEHGYYKLLSNVSEHKLKNNLAVSKEYGAFYTPINLAREMANDVLNITQSAVIIDPCCGTGNLLAACLEQAKEKNKKLIKVIGIELDPLAADICRKGLSRLKESLGLNVQIEIIESDAIEFLGKQLDIFPKVLPKGSIIINPPYGKLKVDSSTMTNAETKLDYLGSHAEKKKEKNITRKASVNRLMGGSKKSKNTLEWSSVFLELCIDELSENEGLVYLGPCSWLNSKSHVSLREELIFTNKLNKIHFISEDNTGFETVNQPLAIVNITADAINTDISIYNDSKPAKSINISELNSLEPFGYPLPRVSTNELELYIKLQHFNRLSELESVVNLRGELDQSINKSVMSSQSSQLRVIRGENIGRYSEVEVDSKRRLFADIVQFNTQLASKPKGQAHKRQRIVGRQCSYMKQERRLIFCIIPEDCIVGNSCNYITAPDEDIHFYLALLNSSLFDWYFRVLNGNNHVANYEINNFPIPVVSDNVKERIITEVNSLIMNKQYRSNTTATKYFNNEAMLDSLIFKMFDLTNSEVELVLNKSTRSEYKSMVLNYLQNGED